MKTPVMMCRVSALLPTPPAPSKVTLYFGLIGMFFSVLGFLSGILSGKQ